MMLRSSRPRGAALASANNKKRMGIAPVRSSTNGSGASAPVDVATAADQQTLLEVQRNLIEVDSARARAMQDVEYISGKLAEERAARAEAEARAQSLAGNLAAAVARVAELELALNGARTAPPAAAAPAAVAVADPPAPAAPAAAAAAPAGTIVVQYHSGWPNVFIHYSADGKGWTASPGVKLAREGEGGPRTFSVQAGSLEFVMNNGSGDWDAPGRYTEAPGNYKITKPGTYKLKSGRLERLSD